jgi:cytidylate kinase
MTSGGDIGRCLAFIGCQLGPQESPGRLGHGQFRPAITFSRQTGSGAMDIARKLADYLQAKAPAHCGWTVFDKNLVTRMLKEHDLPERLAQFLPEDRISRIRDIVENLLGLHPPSETMVRQVSETVVHLAEMGHAILVGRAANVITRHMESVFHVRLVAPLDKRVEKVMERTHMDHAAALAVIHREDAARRAYIKEYFGHDPDDVLLYDLVVNTARIAPEAAARLIGDTVIEWIKTPRTEGQRTSMALG